MYQLYFYVPETHLEVVKTAVFEAGAGRLGNYDRCAWQVKGLGQFRPLQGSRPFLGQTLDLETPVEYKVEMLCGDDCIAAVVTALIAAHPYEEPAYGILKIMAGDDFPGCEKPVH